MLGTLRVLAFRVVFSLSRKHFYRCKAGTICLTTEQSLAMQWDKKEFQFLSSLHISIRFDGRRPGSNQYQMGQGLLG